MKCFIIDDEPLARKGLKEYIDQTPNLEFVGEANNPIEAMALIDQLMPDVLFLDIQMPQMTGIEFVNEFKPDIPVIYTTAYAKYAVESFDLDVEDYLLKPIQYDRFLRAVNRLYKRKAKIDLEGKDSFFVRSEGVWQKIVFEEVLFIKSIQNYVKIFLEDGNYVVHQTLKSIEAELPQHDFLKVQKSYIVNKKKVDAFDGHLIYIKKHSVPVSRNLIKEVKEELLN